MRALVLTPWSGANTAADNARPLLRDFLDLSWSWRYSDATGQPRLSLIPEPNLLAVELECESAALAAVDADERFLVVWSE
jgi:hypothetical protein